MSIFFKPSYEGLTFCFHYSKIYYTVHRQLFLFVEPFVIKGDVVMFLTIFGSDSSGYDIISYILIAPILGIYFLISFPIGLYCRTLMKTKGYDGSTGFFLGFLFSIIGMLICALKPFNKAETHYQPPYEPYGQPYQNQPYQPYGQPYQPPYDQQYQPPYDQSYQPPILNEQNAVRCPHCLELTPNSSQYCIKCGCKLN